MLPSIALLLSHLTDNADFSLLKLSLSLAETKPAPLALPNYCISTEILLISERKINKASIRLLKNKYSYTGNILTPTINILINIYL